MVLVGVCGALMAPATMALVTDLVEPGPRGAAMGLFNVFGSLGFLAGFLIGGSATDLFGYTPAFLAVGGLELAIALALFPAVDRSRRATVSSDSAAGLGGRPRVTLPPPDMRWCGRPSRALLRRPSLPYGRQMDILVVGAGGSAAGSPTPCWPTSRRSTRPWRSRTAIPQSLTTRPPDVTQRRSVDSDTTHDAVCLAVPMSAVPAAVEAYASRAERAILDVSGEMTDAIAAMREHAPDRERASYHPLFAPPRVPGNVAAVVDEGGPVVEEITAAIEAGGNEVFETTPAEHDEAMETVQAGAHAAVLAWRLAGDDVREEFHTPVSAALDEVADTVTEGRPRCTPRSSAPSTVPTTWPRRPADRRFRLGGVRGPLRARPRRRPRGRERHE